MVLKVTLCHLKMICISIFKFIANKDNGFVTFFIKSKILNNMIKDVLQQGGDPPANKLRK